MNTSNYAVQTEGKMQVNIMSYNLLWKLHIDEETLRT